MKSAGTRPGARLGLSWRYMAKGKAGNMARTVREQQDKRREEKLKQVQEQVDEGSLVIRKMTTKERKENPPLKALGAGMMGSVTKTAAAETPPPASEDSPPVTLLNAKQPEAAPATAEARPRCSTWCRRSPRPRPTRYRSPRT